MQKISTGKPAIYVPSSGSAFSFKRPRRHSVRPPGQACKPARPLKVIGERRASVEQCGPVKAAKHAAIAGGVAAILGFLVILATPADARVLTEKQETELTPSSKSKESSLPVKQQVNEVLRISRQAQDSAQSGNYIQALEDYTSITKQYPGLAISNYARVGRALMLYQTGNISEAILELQDLEASLRGFAEVHAALASIIYAERPSEISYAEQQFDLASEFDGRYQDLRWVEQEKHWPPALLRALDKFASLK